MATAPRTRPWAIFILLAIAAAAALGIYRLAIDSYNGRLRGELTASALNRPLFNRDGERLVVPEDSPARNDLVIAPVSAKQMERTLTLPAVVEADPARTVKVLPPVAGRVVDLKVQLGERVTADQELAVIDSGDLAQAYSDLEKAKSVLALTKNALDRNSGLVKAGGGAVKDFEQAQSDYAQAQAEFERSETHLRAIGVASDGGAATRLLSLKSPITGSVIDLQMASGAYLNDPTAAVMTIANLNVVWVTANAPEKDTALVTKGQSADIVFTAYPNETFKGEVLFVSDVLEPDTRRTKVRIAIANTDMRIKPNMFASVVFHAPPITVPVIPTSALVLKNETDRVFVEVAPWTFEAHAVEVGFQQGDQATVQSGIKAGDRVVVKGGVLLND